MCAASALVKYLRNAGEGCSHRTWWINQLALSKPISGQFFSDEAVPRGLLFPERGSLRALLLTRSSTSPRDKTATPSSLRASQAGIGGKGHESTSRAVHRRFELFSSFVTRLVSSHRSSFYNGRGWNRAREEASTANRTKTEGRARTRQKNVGRTGGDEPAGLQKTEGSSPGQSGRERSLLPRRTIVPLIGISTHLRSGVPLTSSPLRFQGKPQPLF